MAEEYIRLLNKLAGRFAEPLVSRLPAKTRDIVNELAFRLFVASVERDSSISALPKEIEERSVQEAIAYIRRLPKHGRSSARAVTSQQIKEARNIARRLVHFFGRVASPELRLYPPFQGCGWIDDCVGDVFAGETIFEVKAGERGFRAIDLRQVLIYCALDFAGKTVGINRICLINPRMGSFFAEPLEQLCQNAAAQSATEVLAEIVDYATEPTGRYLAE